MPALPPSQIVPWWEKIGYGVGDAAATWLVLAIASFQTTIDTAAFGLTAAAAGTVLLVVRLGGAGFDPIMGMIADRTLRAERPVSPLAALERPSPGPDRRPGVPALHLRPHRKFWIRPRHLIAARPRLFGDPSALLRPGRHHDFGPGPAHGSVRDPVRFRPARCGRFSNPGVAPGQRARPGRQCPRPPTDAGADFPAVHRRLPGDLLRHPRAEFIRRTTIQIRSDGISGTSAAISRGSCSVSSSSSSP